MKERSIPSAVTLALLLLMAYSFTHWALLLSAAGPTPIPPPAPVGEQTPRTQALDVSGLQKAFGSGTPAATVSRVRLVGTMAGSSAQSSMALLAVDGQPAHPVRVGQELVDGSILLEVRSGNVVLRQNGVTRTLSLPQRSPMAGISTQTD